MHPVVKVISRLLAIALAVLVGASCASTPAKIQRVEFRSQCDCEVNTLPLGDLLDLTLQDPDSPDSSHALAHFVERWKVEQNDATTGELAGSSSRYHVRFGKGSGVEETLAYYDRVSPAVDFVLHKLDHHRREGHGAPLVAIRENRHQQDIENYYPPEGITRALTAVVRASRPAASGVTDVRIDLLSPLRHRSVVVAGKSVPLAADFSAPWATLLSRSKGLDKAGRRDIVRRDPKRDPQLYLMEPYDPNKEPVIMIHGLYSTPLVWARLSNSLWADEAFRERYQIWHYLYNTSAPALYSGRILRTQLRELRPKLDPGGRDRAMASTTVIAHSMGGIITRSLITRPGNIFWDAAITRPIDELKLSEADRVSLREAFFWEPEAHVKRVIFIAASHLGSDHADKPMAKLARVLVKPPSQFGKFYDRISSANPGVFTKAYADLGTGKLDSIHALSPRQPTLKILASIPNSHPVQMHSIIARKHERGTLEDSSDGVVPYWSSHLPDADSELVVVSGHYAINHPETLVEIKRILTP